MSHNQTTELCRCRYDIGDGFWKSVWRSIPPRSILSSDAVLRCSGSSNRTGYIYEPRLELYSDPAQCIVHVSRAYYILVRITTGGLSVVTVYRVYDVCEKPLSSCRPAAKGRRTNSYHRPLP